MLKRILFYLFVIGGLYGGVAVVAAADVDIVISEIMINAIHESSNVGEWIEIYNRGATPVDLAGWQLEDNVATDMIATNMCPSNDCQIPAGECWLVAVNSSDLQTEFNNYNPTPTVDSTRTIFIGTSIGNGLANTNDRLILRNSTGTAVDCYSWDASGTCSTLTYISGGNGVDANLDGSDGQSVTNVQGTWYDHAVNGSPYNCTNTADGGSPTAVSLHLINSSNQITSLTAISLSAFFLTLISGVVVRRRRR